jgi:hypothetical protein
VFNKGPFSDDLYARSLVSIQTPIGVERPRSLDGAITTLRSWASSDVSVSIDTESGVLSAEGSGSQMIGFLLGRSVVESTLAPKV